MFHFFFSNLKKNNYPKNLLSGIPLGVDADSDGISDGWSARAGNDGTGSASIEDLAQKVVLDSSLTVDSLYQIFHPSPYIDVVEGSTITLSCNYKFAITAGEPMFVFGVDYYAGIDYVDSSIIIKTENQSSYTNITESFTVPSTVTSARLFLRVRANTVGGTGASWVKDLSVIIS